MASRRCCICGSITIGIAVAAMLWIRAAACIRLDAPCSRAQLEDLAVHLRAWASGPPYSFHVHPARQESGSAAQELGPAALSKSPERIAHEHVDVAAFTADAVKFYPPERVCTLRRPTCVASIFAFERDGSEEARQLAAIDANHDAYSRAMGYTYCVGRRVSPTRTATWSKYILVAASLHVCSVSMWLDADTVFLVKLPLAPLLGEMRARNAALVFTLVSGLWAAPCEPRGLLGNVRESRSVLKLLGEGWYPNAGVFLVANTSFSRSWLANLYATVPDVHWARDGTHFLSRHDNPHMAKSSVVIAKSAHSNHLLWAAAEDMNSAPSLWVSGMLLLHLAGFSSHRFRFMEDLVETPGCALSSGEPGNFSAVPRVCSKLTCDFLVRECMVKAKHGGTDNSAKNATSSVLARCTSKYKGICSGDLCSAARPHNATQSHTHSSMASNQTAERAASTQRRETTATSVEPARTESKPIAEIARSLRAVKGRL